MEITGLCSDMFLFVYKGVFYSFNKTYFMHVNVYMCHVIVKMGWEGWAFCSYRVYLNTNLIETYHTSWSLKGIYFVRWFFFLQSFDISDPFFFFFLLFSSFSFFWSDFLLTYLENERQLAKCLHKMTLEVVCPFAAEAGVYHGSAFGEK